MNEMQRACAVETMGAAGTLLSQIAMSLAVFKLSAFVTAAIGLAWLGWIVGLLSLLAFFLSGVGFMLSAAMGRGLKLLFAGFLDGLYSQPAKPPIV